MKLQIALDMVNTEQTMIILEDIIEFVHIVEIGTPMIIDFGMEPVKAVKAQYSSIEVLADTKIMDAGEYEAAMAFRAGADIVTVMGITHDETITGAVKAAKSAGGKIMADMMCVKDMEMRSRELVQLGVDYICVHTAVDVQSTENPYADLARVQKSVGSEHSAIAGGICLTTLDKVVPYKPEIVIVGNGITGQPNLRTGAEAINKKISLR